MDSASHRHFLHEIGQYPVQCAVPVFFGAPPPQPQSSVINSGTATLLRLNDKFLAVTCFHVVQAYRVRAANNPTTLQIGGLSIDLDATLISEDERQDLAVFDLGSLDRTGIGVAGTRFTEPTRWPPGHITTEDVLAFAGFPGDWRERTGPAHYRFYSFTYGAAQVVSVREDQITSTIQFDQCEVEIINAKTFGAIGGVSGGPVFVWRTDPILYAELVNFIYEYQDSLDLLFIRPASVLVDTGHILPPPIGA